jgi:hypothetical protein
MSHLQRVRRKNLQKLGTRRRQATEPALQTVLHTRSCSSDGTSSSTQWKYQRLIGRRVTGPNEEDVEYLVQWTPTWEKASDIGDLQSAVWAFDQWNNNQCLVHVESSGESGSETGDLGTVESARSTTERRMPQKELVIPFAPLFSLCVPSNKLVRTVDEQDLRIAITVSRGRSK